MTLKNIILLSFALTLLIINNAQAVTCYSGFGPEYCKAQGYISANQGGCDGGICQFPDGHMCPADEFYLGTCGAEYKKSCIKNGEKVYYFDKCCNGIKISNETFNGFSSRTTCRPYITGLPIKLFVDYLPITLITVVMMVLITLLVARLKNKRNNTKF